MSKGLVKSAIFLEVDLLDEPAYPFKRKVNITELFSTKAVPLSTGTRDIWDFPLPQLLPAHSIFNLLGLAKLIGAKMFSRNSYNLFPIILEEVVYLKRAPLKAMYQPALVE